MNGKGDKYRPTNKLRFDSNYDRINWSHWFVYLVECSDGTFYCGSTNNLEKRIRTHNEGRGAKYTTSRKPVKLVYSEECSNKSEALKREYQIKKMKRNLKLCMINGYNAKVNSGTIKVTE